MSPNQSPQVLPPKEHNIFKSVVRFYETKQLKKALKAAESILKRFPLHGETLAMKGLTLNALDRKAEANELVRKGLHLQMKSHICWHVFGLLFRSDRDYREAAKAYLNALKFDKDNQQILRDLALLQVQIRNYEGLEETRRQLLTVKPNQRNNWIGFALSFHLLGNYNTAVSVLDTYQDTLKQSSQPEDRYEASELILYKNFILEESAQYQVALSHLDENAQRIVDRIALREARARLLSALQLHDQAAVEIRNLLALNPDNHTYIRALQACEIKCQNPDRALNGIASLSLCAAVKNCCSFEKAFGLNKIAQLQKRTFAALPPIESEQDINIALQVCDELSKHYPYSRSAARIAMDVMPNGEHAQFVARIDEYVRPFLRRGIPSLFSDIKPLYEDGTKAKAFGNLFERFVKAVEGSENGSLPTLTPMHEQQECEQVKVEPSCTLLWVLHFLAQHYDRLGMREVALATIEKAISVAPETVECYLVKARILKHLGDFSGAVEVADKARKMDLADRYLNTKCCKYGLLADRMSDAEGWVSLFTRDGDSGGAQALYDMQCMWFELGAAECHMRKNEIAQALKKFSAVERHFADMIEDQFDFHSYCLRKVTLRAYVSLLRFEDEIRAHPYYARAACGVVRCVVRLYDMPSRERMMMVGEHTDIKGFGEMSEAERKKAVSKRKKQLARQKQSKHGSSGGRGGSSKGGGKGGGKGVGKGTQNGAEKGIIEGNESNSGNGNGNENKQKGMTVGWMEVDGQGIEYVKSVFEKEESGKELLHEASKVIRVCQKHAGGFVETHELALEIALRSNKYLQALRAVRAGGRIDENSAQVLKMKLQLSWQIEKDGGMKSCMSSIAKSVYEREGASVLEKSRIEMAEEYLKSHDNNGERRVGARRALLWLARNGDKSVQGGVEKCVEQLCKSITRCIGGGVNSNTLSAKYCNTMIVQLRTSHNDFTLRRVAISIRMLHPHASFLDD